MAPTTAAPIASMTSAADSGGVPVKVRPVESKVIWAITGIPGARSRQARSAARISLRSAIVSMMMKSGRAMANASACSANCSYASSKLTSPRGSTNAPSGPTEAATSAPRPDAARLAISTPARLISRAAWARPKWLRRRDVPPKVQVSMTWAPASTYCRWIDSTSPGRSRHHASGHAPGGSPRAWSMVPNAPSKTNTSSPRIRSSLRAFIRSTPPCAGRRRMPGVTMRLEQRQSPFRTMRPERLSPASSCS